MKKCFGLLKEVAGNKPVIADNTLLMDGAILIGRVELKEGATVWYNAVLRAENASITVGENSSIQDNCVIHVEEEFPATIGKNVTVGHCAILHGCTIEDNCIIGMGATVMDGAVVKSGSIVGAGALVAEGKVIENNSVVMGIPAKLIRKSDDKTLNKISENANAYANYRKMYGLE